MYAHKCTWFYIIFVVASITRQCVGLSNQWKINCETIAKGLIAAKHLVNVPLVVRLEGTNSEAARELIATVPDIIAAQNLDDAASRVVSLSKTPK